MAHDDGSLMEAGITCLVYPFGSAHEELLLLVAEAEDYCQRKLKAWSVIHLHVYTTLTNSDRRSCHCKHGISVWRRSCVDATARVW